MKKYFFSIALVISLLTAYAGYAEESSGWKPKWNVGDWWVVEIEYNSSKFNPVAEPVKPKWEKSRIKYTVMSDDILDGEEIYRIEILPIDQKNIGPNKRDLFISKQQLFLRKIRLYNQENQIYEEYIIDKTSAGNFISLGTFNLQALPIFPLRSLNEKRQDLIKFKSGHSEKGFHEGSRWIQQTTEILDTNLLNTDEKVNKMFLNGQLYKITIDNKYIEYWTKKAPWYIYFEEGKNIKGYLKEYNHNN